MDRYELTDFFDLPEDPIVDRVIPIKGKQVPILKLFRICGTVLDRDKAKKTVTLLTTSGVVTVKIFGGVFAQYDKQISERGADGKKQILSVKISEEVVDPDDIETLEDLIVAAVNEAINKVEADASAEMSEITGALNMPGMPF